MVRRRILHPIRKGRRGPRLAVLQPLHLQRHRRRAAAKG
jgi:hypothetical protein